MFFCVVKAPHLRLCKPGQGLLLVVFRFHILRPRDNSALVSRFDDSLQARDCSSALLRFRV